MAGMYTPGEVKVRPGTYYNIQKVGENTATIVDGITAVLFRADWGPLNEAVEIKAEVNYGSIFGSAFTTDAIGEVMKGGAKTVIGCRIGSGGSAGKVTLKDSTSQDAVTLTAKYVGDKNFTITVREKLSDDTKKECIIYTGTSEFEKVQFTKGEDETSALAAAFSKSKNFVAETLGGSGALENVSQAVFTNGANPTVTTESYSDGLTVMESASWNTICVDTEAMEVHTLLANFLDRISEAGQLAMGIVAESTAVLYDDRVQHASEYNSEKIVYVVNPSAKTSIGTVNGYQVAARIAGMISACPSNQSLTHTVIEGYTELADRITPTQIIDAETKGCLVLTTNANKEVWIDSAINTLVELGENQDEGWKKIRRTKTRYELITRANIQAESMVGFVDNDTNGRATIVSQVQGVGSQMVEEGKLVSCNVTESTAEGDSCWFSIDAVDKDSAEHIYLTFKFRFSTQE